MAKNTYETLFILDSNHYARDPGGVSKQLEQIVTENGGTVLVNRVWMEQKLAYPIDGHQKGTYWLTYYEAEGDSLVKMARAFTLCEPVVRELTLKLDPRLVEPMLANARGQSFSPSLTSSSDEGSEDAEDGDDSDGADASRDDAVASR
ncbi:30S ribosomal protein S6 [Novipirellula artificiosorum]|uniref:Small ribosomal subunit protein bS6 n=1 Tax=Novipirellula artificiosorum TaxID=2528016 RepID=A0A5C6DDD2_9BACT|nr:30S ribosomal protein S6 [Novipirellula artificiosorum]TWU33777.1 30S ribosomal protein S6 [Novipirellula artificiosorum]